MATVTLWDETRRRYGQRHHRARYSDALVEQARQLDDAGVNRAVIARRLGVPYDTARDWIEYRTRTHG